MLSWKCRPSKDFVWKYLNIFSGSRQSFYNILASTFFICDWYCIQGSHYITCDSRREVPANFPFFQMCLLDHPVDGGGLWWCEQDYLRSAFELAASSWCCNHINMKYLAASTWCCKQSRKVSNKKQMLHYNHFNIRFSAASSLNSNMLIWDCQQQWYFLAAESKSIRIFIFGASLLWPFSLQMYKGKS